MPRQAQELRAQSPQGDFSFGDFIDIINPLQHIPVIGTIYRAMTGDTVSQPASQILGDALYGGPIGAITSIASAIISGDGQNSDPVQLAWNALAGEEQNLSAEHKEDAPSMLAAAKNISAPALDSADTAAPTIFAQANAASDKSPVSPPQTALENQSGVASSKSIELASVDAPNQSALNIAASTKMILASNQNSDGGQTDLPPTKSPLVSKLTRSGLSPYRQGYIAQASYVPPSPQNAHITGGTSANVMKAPTSPDGSANATQTGAMPADYFTSRMLQALDRYQAASKASTANSEPAMQNSY